MRPLCALEYQRIKRGGRFRWEVFIEWKALPLEDLTWEHLAMMREHFSKFVLEDKDILEGDGNDVHEGRRLKSSYNHAQRVKMRARGRGQQTKGQAK